MKTQNSISCLHGRLFTIVGLMLATTVAVRADYQSTVLGDKPLAYYTLDLTIDDAGTATDLSGNGNNSTYYNIYPTTGPSAYIPNAAIFTGSSIQSYVDLSTGGNPSLLNFGGTITMEAWAQPASTSVGSGPAADVIGKGYDGSYEMTLRAQGGNYYGGIYDGNTYAASGGVQTTNWTYLVSTYDGANWNLYVNGILVQSNPGSVGAVSFSAPWAIGVGTPNGNDRWFQGNICQVALYTNALTAAQVLAHYYSAELNASPNTSVPIINTQPQSQSSYLGGSVTFSVTAVSASAMTNQWFKDGDPISGQTGASLSLNNLQFTNAGNYSVVVGNANGTTNSVVASLTVNTPASLQWSPNDNNGNWDTGTSANWINLSNSSQVAFNAGDQVLFDDTASVPTSVSINGTVLPSAITVDSSVNNFSFSGGNIGGSGGLTKAGSSLLNITSGGGFTGPVTIKGGSIYAGNNAFASASSITVTNDATLDLGGGTFSGNKSITISGNGANGIGAINNSYDDYPVQSVSITLAGDASLGASKRWDLAAGSSISGPYTLTMNWAGSTYSEWTSPTIGADVVNIILTNGNFGAKSMSSSFQNPNTMFTVSSNCQLYFWSTGDGLNGSIHLLSGAQIQHLGAPSTFNGSDIILETGADFVSYGNTNADAATPVNSLITLNGIARFEIGDHNLIFTNLISGPGGFIWNNWNHQMVLSASNTYAGPTVLGDGPQIALTDNGSIAHSSLIFFGGSNPDSVHVDATGRPDQTLALASGQTLAGIGAVNGKLVVSSGAIISPAGTNTTINITAGANATGSLVASNDVVLNGTTVLKLNGSGTNDAVQSSTSIAYGGTLNLVNISGSPLAAGDSFQVFNAPAYSGSFTSTNLPALEAGLAWDLSQLNTGLIGVVTTGSSGPVVGSTQIVGRNVVLAGSGGAINGTYYVLTATDLTTPLANWTRVATNNYDGNGNFTVSLPLTPGTPQQFYRIQQ